MSQLSPLGAGTRGSVWLVGGAADIADGPLDFADASIADHRDGPQEVAVHLTAPLRADLEDALGLVEHLDDLLPLVDGEGQRLFAVDVFAGLHRLDRQLGVPVVGRDDRHDVDVLAVENAAIIAVDIGLRMRPFFDWIFSTIWRPFSA